MGIKFRLNNKKMPRRGGGFGRSSSPSNNRSTTKTAPPPAQTQKPAPPQQTSTGGGMMSGLMGTMMQGMAFGAGSEVAHTAMRGLMGGSGHQEQQQAPVQQQPANNMCQTEMGNFTECLKFNSNDIAGCQNYLDLLKSCEQRYN